MGTKEDEKKNDTSLIEAIARFCPVFHFAEDEKYMPASFQYIASRSRLVRDGKVVIPKGNAALFKKRILEDLEASSTPCDNESAILWESTSDTDGKLLLDIGPRIASDGYAGNVPNENHDLFGDPNVGIQRISAYSLGTHVFESGVKFCDVVFAVHFMWNGTIGYHACDIEEAVVRLQYFPKSIDMTNGHGRVADRSIFADQGFSNGDPRGHWALTRIFLSAHGNGCWYPTKRPGRRTTKIEFEGSRPVLFSARASHALYPTPGDRKRIFGFANDQPRRSQKNIWRPAQVVLWMPAFVTLKQRVVGSTQRPKKPIIVDVGLRRELTPDRMRGDAYVFLWLSYFRGQIGNADNAQSTVPFKSGLLNCLSDSDCYYKFQGGGAESAIDQVLSPKGQKCVLIASILLFVVCGGLIIFMGVKIERDCDGGGIGIGAVFTSAVASVSLALFAFLYFVGNRSASM
eukprot:g3102.t1